MHPHPMHASPFTHTPNSTQTNNTTTHNRQVDAKVVLDHGAGPFTNLGARLRCPASGVDALVTSVDPLAPAYHAMLNANRIYNTLRPSFCKSEDLLCCFCPETFDFVVVINALDHSEDAVRGWLNSAAVTRPGGLTCLVTMKNEATKLRNQGFHQWNFAPSADGALMFEDTRAGRATNVSALMRGLGAKLAAFEHEPANKFGVLKACWQKAGGAGAA